MSFKRILLIVIFIQIIVCSLFSQEGRTLDDYYQFASRDTFELKTA